MYRRKEQEEEEGRRCWSATGDLRLTGDLPGGLDEEKLAPKYKQSTGASARDGSRRILGSSYSWLEPQLVDISLTPTDTFCENFQLWIRV